MTRFVRLTGLNGSEIYLNVDKIISIWRNCDSCPMHTDITTVADSTDSQYGQYRVQETPDDVLRLIRNSINENVEKLVIQIENPVTDSNIDEALRKINEAKAKLLGA